MAHFVLEYSDHLSQTDDTIQTLFAALHEAAKETGMFPYKGIRSRAYCCKQYRMADGNPEHGFAHLEVKLGAGREQAQKQAAADAFFKVFTAHFEQQVQQRGMALSFEMRELEPVLKFNKNNIADYL